MTVKSIKKSYLGPKVSSEEGRAYAKTYSSNLAPSYIPQCLLHLNRSSYYKKPVESLLHKPEVTLKLLKQLKGDIDNHFENRLQLFFQQLLIVWGTGFTFTFFDKADLQIGKPEVTDPVKKATSEKGKYAAAHSSTLPALRLAQGEDSVVFLAGSYFQMSWNTTVCLPEVVNQVDSALDRYSKKIQEPQCFRFRATEVLNKASQGEYSPRKAFKVFVGQVCSHLDKLAEGEENPLKSYVISRYQKVAAVYKEQLKEGDDLIKALCYRPEAPTVDTEFFKKVQKSIHRRLIKEMEALKPVPPPKVTFAKGENPKVKHLPTIQAHLKQLRKEGNTSLQRVEGSKKALQYAKICAADPQVRFAALTYFKQIKKDTQVVKDITACLKFGASKSATAQKKIGEERFYTLYTAALATLRSRVQEPNNMGGILVNVLEAVAKAH